MRRALEQAPDFAARDARVRPMYEFTYQLAALEPPRPVMQQLFLAMRDDQAATNAFFSALSGATPLADFMSEANRERIIGAGRGA